MNRDLLQINLQQFYNIQDPDAPPVKRKKLQWRKDNKFGFFKGVLSSPTTPKNEEHVQELSDMLSNDSFAQNSENFLDELFKYYLYPYHKDLRLKRDKEGSNFISGQNSASDVEAGPSHSPDAMSITGENDMTPPNHPDVSRLSSAPGSQDSASTVSSTDGRFRDGLHERDERCLFCWDLEKKNLEAAHILGRKRDAIRDYVGGDIMSILREAGLEDANALQNGLLLCNACHNGFDTLDRYVDVDHNGQMRVVVTNEDTDDGMYVKEKIRDRRDLCLRFVKKETERLILTQIIQNDMLNLPLHFVSNDATIRPSRILLKMHKRACLIWKLAGGAEPRDIDIDSDDEDIKLTTAEKRKMYNWTSIDTLCDYYPNVQMS